jgi:hypothetical protein
MSEPIPAAERRVRLPRKCACGGKLQYEYGPGDYGPFVVCDTCTPVVEVRIGPAADAAAEPPAGYGPIPDRKHLSEIAWALRNPQCPFPEAKRLRLARMLERFAADTSGALLDAMDTLRDQGYMVTEIPAAEPRCLNCGRTEDQHGYGDGCTYFKTRPVPAARPTNDTRGGRRTVDAGAWMAARPEPPNCQQEPPYPGAETVVCSIRDPDMLCHAKRDDCAIEAPHRWDECGTIHSTLDALADGVRRIWTRVEPSPDPEARCPNHIAARDRLERELPA